MNSVGPAITVVTVIHNSGDVVGDMLRSLPVNCEVIVVDNASTDGGGHVALEARPDARVITQANRGFGTACNVGATSASGEVLVFVNPDVRVSAQVVSALASIAHSEVAAAGPAITDADGRQRHVCRRSSRIVDNAVDLLAPLRRIAPRWMSRDLPQNDPVYRHGGEVDYLQGACFAVPAHLFHDVGGFDERFFLYSEEEDFCDRLRAAGGRCLYVPEVAVAHLWGTSTRKAALVTPYHRFRSAVLLHAKRDGRMRGYACALVVVCAAVIRLAGVSLVALAGIRPERRWAWTMAAVRGAVAGTRAVTPSARTAGL